MIKLETFLSKAEEIKNEKPTYKLGHDGRNGLCDCVGLIIGAVRRSGETWNGTHGSNYAARYKMATLVQPPVLEVGTILYKAYRPGEPGYDLPETYARHPDQNDYYHVGILVSVDPLQIMHCTSWSGGSGIKMDTKIGVWRYGGRLKHLSYEPKEEVPVSEPTKPIGTAVITAKSGLYVRMRAKPNVGALVKVNVPLGDSVDVLGAGPEWSEIRHKNVTGWMMTEFLKDKSTPLAPTTYVSLEQKVDILWAAYQAGRG